MSESAGNTHTDILLAGALAALTIDFLVYPLDTIKTRFQSPDYRRLYTNQASGAVQRSLFRGLYQGVGSIVLATVPSSGAFFTTYEGTKALLHRVDHVSSSSTAIVPEPLINAAASSAGELVSCLILTPAEVLKQNAQVVKRGAHTGAGSMFDGGATRTALKRFRRPGQLWRGYTALAARNLPFTAMQFPLFEHFKKGLLARRPEHRKAADSLLERGIITGVAAGTAGSVAAVITTPIDVVKTRIMLAAGSDESAAAAAPREKKSAAELEIRRAEASSARGRPGTWAVGREVFRVEGVRGLFRGGALRGAWTALGSGLYLSIYESGRAYLERRRHGQDHARGASIA